ncbi:hypothetical protein Vafri_6118, partial [Volvox africanus]
MSRARSDALNLAPPPSLEEDEGEGEGEEDSVAAPASASEARNKCPTPSLTTAVASGPLNRSFASNARATLSSRDDHDHDHDRMPPEPPAPASAVLSWPPTPPLADPETVKTASTVPSATASSHCNNGSSSSRNKTAGRQRSDTQPLSTSNMLVGASEPDAASARRRSCRAQSSCGKSGLTPARCARATSINKPTASGASSSRTRGVRERQATRPAARSISARS